jgi:hypothetical protein
MADMPLARPSPALPLRHRLAVLRWLSAPDQGPLEYGRRLWLKLVLAVIFIALYAPIAILIAFSFNDSRRNIVWQGFTTKYYGSPGATPRWSRPSSTRSPSPSCAPSSPPSSAP